MTDEEIAKNIDIKMKSGNFVSSQELILWWSWAATELIHTVFQTPDDRPLSNATAEEWGFYNKQSLYDRFKLSADDQDKFPILEPMYSEICGKLEQPDEVFCDCGDSISKSDLKCGNCQFVENLSSNDGELVKALEHIKELCNSENYECSNCYTSIQDEIDKLIIRFSKAENKKVGVKLSP